MVLLEVVQNAVHQGAQVFGPDGAETRRTVTPRGQFSEAAVHRCYSVLLLEVRSGMPFVDRLLWTSSSSSPAAAALDWRRRWWWWSTL